MLEILAPCGNEESLTAALNSGADAVYLGLKSFSARRNAANFSGEELEKAVNTAHRQGVRVYVTLNTLVFDDEMGELEKTVEEISRAKADGVIVQDFGVVKKVKEIAPELRLHGSTQMTVTSASGAEFALKQGFSRVVLPRE
ncbi:MAG: U32 family peptidase, partial [Ruminiclostridium sp.]|nr:U32 family peptidase [Ruminiclostridium sp.]